MNDTPERAPGLPANVAHEGGRIVSRIPPERKTQIIADACDSIMQGDTIAQIAGKHGISPRTLDMWLHALGDEYRELRSAWLDKMLIEAGEEIEGADDQLRLARARELFRRATWYAERRDSARYGARNEGQQATQINIIVER